jgi:hypothetical protein
MPEETAQETPQIADPTPVQACPAPSWDSGNSEAAFD